MTSTQVLLDSSSPCLCCMALQRACAVTPRRGPGLGLKVGGFVLILARAPFPGAWASWGSCGNSQRSGNVVTEGDTGINCLGFSALCPSFRGSLFMLFLCSLVSCSPSLPPTTLPFPILQALRRELIHSGFHLCCSLWVEGYSSLSQPCKYVIFQDRVQMSLP